MYSVITDHRHQKLILLIAAFAIFMDGLDTSIVNVALPVIAADLHIDISGSSWVVMAYLLFLAGFMLAFGKIADNGKIQTIFIIGFALFAASSLVCALSPNMAVMIIARACEGLGASMIAADAPLLITRFLPENRRGLGMGVIATAGGIATAFGPALGGFITEFLSWHWIFLINIPIGIAAIFFARAVIPKPGKKPSRAPFDRLGTALMFAATAAFLIFLERGPEFGWTNPVIISLIALFILTGAGFCIRSLTCPYALLNIRIFKHWKFTAVTVSYLLTCAVFAGIMYMLPYYMQNAMGLAASVAGLLLMLCSIITACIGIPVGSWSDKIGCKLPCILAAVFRIVFCTIFLFIIPAYGLWALIPALICMGLSFGISGGPATTRITQMAPKGEEGTGTGVMITSDFLGGDVGVAAYAMVFGITVPAAIGIPAAELSTDLFMTGFHATSALGLAFGIITLVLSSIVPNLIVKENKAASEKLL